ncbi:MAG: hypothetical protein U1C59_07475, partial [Methylotenera sp.]|nr:hypothetical protein [Methylotenera sp.]
FELDGKKMKASNIGKKFTANGLEKEGVTYDKTRDFEQLKKLAKPTNAGLASTNDSATRSEQNAAQKGLERGVSRDFGADTNYEKADDSSHFGIVSQPNIHSSFDLANTSTAGSTNASSADSTRNSANTKTTKPNKQPEKEIEMSRFTDRIEWVQMHNERTIGRKDVSMQYGGRLNRRLKTLNINNFEGIDFVKLDQEVAAEMLEAGVPGYDISRTIFTKSPHDYGDLGQVRGTVEAVAAKLKSTKELAEKAIAAKFDQQTAMSKEIQENTNTYWKPPSLD